MKKILGILLALTLLVTILPLGNVVLADPLISTVAQSDTPYNIRLTSQHGAFYDAGRYWQLYIDDEQDICFKTSTDGEAWSSATEIGDAAYRGATYDVFFDGTYVHYVRNTALDSPDYKGIAYRRGTPQSDGSITWCEVEQTVLANTVIANDIQLAIDSNGYVWIGYAGDQSNYGYPTVIKSSTNDGTWSTAAGFPYEFFDTEDDWFVIPVAQTSGKVYCIVYRSATSEEVIKGYQWDGDSWEAQQDATTSDLSNGSGSGYFGMLSAVGIGDDIHLAFRATAGGIKHVIRTSGSWGGESTIEATLLSTKSTPVLTKRLNGDLVCSWSYAIWDFPTGSDCWVYCKVYSDGSWDSSATEVLYSEDSFEYPYNLQAYYEEYEGMNGDFVFAYESTLSVPYNIIHVIGFLSPEAECQAASNIGSTTARLNGIITDDKGNDCEARFRYGEVIQKDDFEWGEDEDDLDTNGGGITWTVTDAGSSTVKIDDAYSHSGTRSARFYRVGTDNPGAYFTQAPLTNSQVLSIWVRKNDTARFIIYYGNGIKVINFSFWEDEQLDTYDGADHHKYGAAGDYDTLVHFEVKNVDWDAGTYDVYVDDVLLADGAAMRASGSWNGNIYFYNQVGTSNLWLDDVLVHEAWTETDWQNSLNTDSTYYEDIASLDALTDYIFQTQAREIVGDNEGAWSDSLYFTTCPTAPTDVAATDGEHTDKVVVNWIKSEGATGYKVYGDGELLDTLGDVATYDDTSAPAPTITAGSTIASDGSSTAHVSLELSGTSANNGTLRTYKVKAFNDSGDSPDSDTDTGYRGHGALTYQWQRSSGDADENYSNIDGATDSTYNDTDAPAPTITPGSTVATDGDSTAHVSLSLDGTSTSGGTGRYYQCILNADGAAEQTSASNRGYRTVGELSYQWQRSSGDADEDYSNIDGATSSTYDDTEAPAPTITPGNADAADGTSTEYVTLTLTGQQGNDGDGRYYQCVLNADGAVEQTSSSNRGHRGVDTLSLQWQRSAADSDADYSNIIGAVSTPYNDANGVAAPDGRYYQGIVSMPGAISQNSTTDRGYFLAIVAPNVTAYNTTGITGVSGILHGEITLTGYENASTIGFEWGLTVGNYTYNWADTGSFGLGTFDHEITDLLTNTTYFWRAFAINAGGRGNSTALNFTTLALPFLPTNFTATAIGTSAVNLTWTMGVAANITVIRYRESGYPTSPTEGLPAYSGNGTWTIIEGLNLDTTIYYFSAWSYNDFGYSIDYATAKIGGNMQAILMFGLLFLVAIGFIVLYLWKREMWLGIAAGTVWVATAIYAWVGYEAPTPAMTTMWFGLGWLFLAIGLALLVAPLSWNKTKDEIWEESMDPDTGEPIMEEYKNGNKTGQTRPLTDLEMTERQQPQEKRRRDKSSKFSREGRL